MSGRSGRFKLGYFMVFAWALLAAAGCEPWRSRIAELFPAEPLLIMSIFALAPGIIGFYWTNQRFTRSLKLLAVLGSLALLFVPLAMRWLIDADDLFTDIAIKRMIVKAALMYPTFLIGLAAKWFSTRAVGAPQNWR